MKWKEFRDMLIGISPETALGRTVAIRAEKDQKVINRFTPDQRKIWSAWRQRKAKRVSPQTTAAFLEDMKRAFIAMAGVKETKGG